MATSVLGKRTRSTFAVEDISLPLQSRKRRPRIATPRIHTDDAEASKIYTPQDPDLRGPLLDAPRASRPTPTRIVSTKRTTQNRHIQLRTSKPFLSTVLLETVSDENAPPLEFETPNAVRFKDALFPQKIPVTPRHRVRPVGSLSRTPSSIATSGSRTQTVYTVARQLFTQSNAPGKLIGRESERQKVKAFISDAVNAKSGGCTYVSGPPGTGKSALIQELLSDFQSEESLQTAYINCVGIKSSKDVHHRLIEEFCPDLSTGKKAHHGTLASLFTAKRSATPSSYLVVLDEMDSLLDIDCDVLYSLFDWALHHSSCLILIGIANALDLTDRFLPKLKARNLKPQLLPFMPYSANQIAEIIVGRLRSTLPADTTAAKDFVPFIHPAAVLLSSKKVASQTGDLRKAFNLIRRAIDQIEQETLQRDESSLMASPSKLPLAELPNPSAKFPPTPTSDQEVFKRKPTINYTPENAPRATISHIARLSSTIFNNGTSSRLAGLNLQQKAVLCSLVASEKRRARRDPFTTPSKSSGRVPTVKDLFMKYTALCKRDDGLLHPLKVTEFRDVVASLETLGLVHESTGRTGSLLTPTQTPSRAGRNPDEKQIVSGVSEKEMTESLKGPGGDLLIRLFDEK